MWRVPFPNQKKKKIKLHKSTKKSSNQNKINNVENIVMPNFKLYYESSVNQTSRIIQRIYKSQWTRRPKTVLAQPQALDFDEIEKKHMWNI